MGKWYEQKPEQEGIVISSRIRLARNLKKYPFSNGLTTEESQRLIQEVKAAMLNDKTAISQQLDFIELSYKSGLDKLAMMERHMISPELLKKSVPTGVFIHQDESMSIMINEEDHLRLQSVTPGMDIEKAWDLADKIDDVLEETLEYAFDEKYGYLTCCPTNVGTGLRASFMVHIPALEVTGQLRHIVQAISKLGMTVRGMYGEGTEAQGSLYQISNQITLGQSEEQTIQNLKNITNQIIEQEIRIREKFLKEQPIQLEDEIYRAYGTLSHARIISAKEAMKLLSYVRIGYGLGILKKKAPEEGIFQLMMYTQPGNLQKRIGKEVGSSGRDAARATFIRSRLYTNDNS